MSVKGWVVPLLVTAALAGACSDERDATKPPVRELDSGPIAPMQAFEHRFTNEGTYPYHCSFHSMMRAAVVVSAGDPDTLVVVTIVNAGSSGFQPGSATVRTNGRVVWQNQDVATPGGHTITSD